MATSGSKTVAVTSFNDLVFSWWVSDQNTGTLTSTLNWELKLVAGTDGRISSTASKAWSVTIDGTTTSGANTIGVASNSSKVIARGTRAVKHSSDGTKTISYTFSLEFGITFSGTYIGTKSGSGTGTLDTIGQATHMGLTPTESLYFGEKLTITLPRKSSSYTHTLQYLFSAEQERQTLATGVGTSYSWTIPDKASLYPNATSGTLTIYCRTYNGSTYIGQTTRTLTVKVPESVVPSISSITAREYTAGVAEKYGAFIQGSSEIRIDTTTAGAKGSTVKTCSVTFQGKTVKLNSPTSGGVFTWYQDAIKSGSLNIVATITDSRGRTATKTLTIYVEPYEPPKITLFRAARADDEGNAADNGEMALLSYAYSVSSLNAKNTADMKVHWKLSTAAEYNDYPLMSISMTEANRTDLIGSVFFSADYQYDLKMTLTDGVGNTATYTTVLRSGAVIFDIKADGTGIAFGKTADRSGADFGWSVKGPVIGLWAASASIPDNANLDDYTQPGVYAVASNASAVTMTNIPCDKGGTLRVSSGLGVEKVAGPWAYIVQEYHSYHLDCPIYRRTLSSDGEGVFSATAWRPITFRGQKVLWSGAWLMTAGHKAELSEPISEQDSGIVLVFSRYVNNASEDNNFVMRYVPKEFVRQKNGNGLSFDMFTVNFGLACSKYLYVNNAHITGHAQNNAQGTAASGITYDNTAFVLRYVIGV